MKHTFTSIFWLCFFCLSAQTNSAAVHFDFKLTDKEHQFQVSFTYGDKLVFSKVITKSFDSTLTNLPEGEYFLQVSSAKLQAEKLFFNKYELVAEKTTTISLDLNYYREKSGAIFEEREQSEGIEFQSYFGFNNNRYTGESELFSNTWAYRGEVNSFFYKRHIGFAWTSGYEYKWHGIQSDSSFFSYPTDSLKREYYHHFGINYGVKFRVFAGKITSRAYKPKLFMDLGLSYHFPVILRHVARLDNDTKLVEQHISTFTDFRASAVVGWFPLCFYAYYRPFNVVKSPLPQPSKFEFGLSYIIGEQ